MKRISIEKAVVILAADKDAKKHVYLVQNHRTKDKYYTTGKENGYPVCCVCRVDVDVETLKKDGFRTAFVKEESVA